MNYLLSVRFRSIGPQTPLSGKPKMVAVGVLMRKLIHWCFSVLRTRHPFDINYQGVDAQSACKAVF